MSTAASCQGALLHPPQVAWWHAHRVMPHNHLTSSGNAAWHQMEPQLHARQAGPASAAPTSSSSAACRWIDKRKWIKLWTYPPANKPHSSALATHILPSAIPQGTLPPVPPHRHTQRNRGAHLEAPPLSLHSWAQASPLPSAEPRLQHSGYPRLQSRPCPPPPRQQPWCLAQRPQPGAADGTDGQVTNKPLYLLGTKEQDVHIWPFEFPYAQNHPHRRRIFTSVNLEPQYKGNFFKLKVWGRGTHITHGKQPYFTKYLFKRCLREQLQSVHAINPKEATRPCHPSQPELLIWTTDHRNQLDWVFPVLLHPWCMTTTMPEARAEVNSLHTTLH